MIILSLVAIFFCVVALHELIHFLVAIAVGLSPRFGIYKIFPFVEYTTESEIKTIIISLAPGIILPLLGILIPIGDIYFLWFKILLFINVLEITPMSPDGYEVFRSFKTLILSNKHNIKKKDSQL